MPNEVTVTSLSPDLHVLSNGVTIYGSREQAERSAATVGQWPGWFWPLGPVAGPKLPRTEVKEAG